MSLSIAQLKSKWNKEKDSYRKQEIGSGVQKFVKELLASEEVFNLKEGLKSTPLEKRKNEFLEEESKQERDRADIVIFIDSKIIIPVEVEKYGNIEAGQGQIVQYQLSWEKKYGILTDGYAWRFYNNNIYREFMLENIFEETDVFLEFRKEYIQPRFYYQSFFEPPTQKSFLRKAEVLSVEANRQIFFADITQLIRSFKNKLKIEGYFNGLEKKEKEKRAIEITYAYIIQFILYKTLVDNEFDAFSEEFEKSVKKIHECLKSERYKDILGIIDNISNEISRNVYRPFAKEQAFINKKLMVLYRSIENELSDVAPWLDIFVFIKKYNFANVRNEIFGYIYENYLKELFEEEKKGQYFTDSSIVNFMLEQIGYTSLNLKHKLQTEEDRVSLIDPACGSGTFLYSAVDSIISAFGSSSEETSKEIEDIINNNIFGLDIAEFPLYLAEMNIVMRMLPLIISEKYNNPIDKKIKVFLTKDSVAEFIDAELENTFSDFQRKGMQFEFFTTKSGLDYESYVRDEDDLTEMKKSMRPPRRSFDYVIGNPPYVGYNECSKQGILFTELIQEDRVKMSDIYGVNLNTVPGYIKAYAPKPNLYAFFIALGLALLKDHGKLCYIIPQTILTANDLDVLRYHLAKFTTIEKIITFSGRMFVGRGIKQNKAVATSSLIFIIRKENRGPLSMHQVEVINYTDTGDSIEKVMENIRVGKKIQEKKILQNNLLKNLLNWNFITYDKKTEEFIENYKKNSESIDIYRIPALSRPKFKSIFYFDKGLVFPKNKIIDISEKDPKEECYYLTETQKAKYQLDLTTRAVRKSDIIFPKGSQGIDVYDRTYKIIWRYMNYEKFYITNKKIMVNFNWIVISADNKEEIFYLLSLLNSNLNKFVFKKLLSTESEKDMLFGIKAIKNYFRVPKITNDNQFIKSEIIKRTEEVLGLENMTLDDLVDFSGVMVQKFDSLVVENNYLILIKDNEKKKCKIKESSDLVKKTLAPGGSLFGKEKIVLSELKSLPVINIESQKKLKNYIDDLVFALYFNIELEKADISKASTIKNVCSKHKFYMLVQEA